MNIIPQTRRSTWTCHGVEVNSSIVCVDRELHSTPSRLASYRSLYTVEVEVGEKRLRVRAVPNAEAIAWEQQLVLIAFAEFGGAARVGG